MKRWPGRRRKSRGKRRNIAELADSLAPPEEKAQAARRNGSNGGAGGGPGDEPHRPEQDAAPETSGGTDFLPLPRVVLMVLSVFLAYIILVALLIWRTPAGPQNLKGKSPDNRPAKAR